MAGIFEAIGALHGSLDYHLERHNVLASNVAHVDTPGYRPLDVARADASSFGSVMAVALRRTDPGHLHGGNVPSPAVGQTFEDLSAGAGNDDNYVSLDREASKLAANHLRYDVISAIAQAELKSLHYAATDGKG